MKADEKERGNIMKSILQRDIHGYFATFVEEDGALIAIRLGAYAQAGDESPRETGLLAEAARQFDEYFSGKRRAFDLPLRLIGTEFQRAAWHALLEIPYGETRTYRDIAKRINKPGAARAVGQANHRNPIWIAVPCHRVVQTGGGLGGYGGGVEVKRRLLELEGAI
jgi:methylated-DNA-[protein]-cysteine S-methyltransferase